MNHKSYDTHRSRTSNIIKKVQREFVFIHLKENCLKMSCGTVSVLKNRPDFMKM